MGSACWQGALLSGGVRRCRSKALDAEGLEGMTGFLKAEGQRRSLGARKLVQGIFSEASQRSGSQHLGPQCVLHSKLSMVSLGNEVSLGACQTAARMARALLPACRDRPSPNSYLDLHSRKS